MRECWERRRRRCWSIVKPSRRGNRACTGRLDPRRFGVDGPVADGRAAMPGQLYASLVTFAGFLAYLVFLA